LPAAYLKVGGRAVGFGTIDPAVSLYVAITVVSLPCWPGRARIGIVHNVDV